MAEEEVLTEQLVASKKEKAGVPVVLLVLPAVLSVICILLLFMVMGKTGQIKNLEQKIDEIGVQVSGGEAQRQNKVVLADCKKIFELTPDKALIVNLPDGHFISTKISVCVEEGAVGEEELKEKKTPMLYIAQSTLMRYTKQDIFPNAPADAVAPGAEKPAKSGGMEMESDSLDIGSSSGASDTPDSQLNKIRGELLQDMNRNFKYIKDVYLSEFVVD